MKILVPIDVDIASKNALKMAFKLFEQNSEAFLQVLHIEHQDRANEQELVEELRKDVLSGLHEVPHRERFNFSLQVGKPEQILEKAFEKWQPDLIVMADQEIRGWSSLIQHSQSDWVVENSSCPVIITHREDSEHNFQDILLPVTKEPGLVEALTQLSPWVNLWGSTLHLLKVSTITDFYTNLQAKEELSRMVKKHNIANYTFNYWNARDVESGIIEFASQNNIGLITLLTHKHTKLQKILGTTSLEVIHRAHKPILSFCVAR